MVVELAEKMVDEMVAQKGLQKVAYLVAKSEYVTVKQWVALLVGGWVDLWVVVLVGLLVY